MIVQREKETVSSAARADTLREGDEMSNHADEKQREAADGEDGQKSDTVDLDVEIMHIRGVVSNDFAHSPERTSQQGETEDGSDSGGDGDEVGEGFSGRGHGKGDGDAGGKESGDGESGGVRESGAGPFSDGAIPRNHLARGGTVTRATVETDGVDVILLIFENVQSGLASGLLVGVVEEWENKGTFEHDGSDIGGPQRQPCAKQFKFILIFKKYNFGS